MIKPYAFLLSLTIGTAAQAASPLDTNPTAKAAVQRYADLVHASYTSALRETKIMQVAVNNFLAAPDQSRLLAARQAWINAHRVYGETEGFRFYDGPIDGTVGVEGQVNSWPMDESYLDYVVGAPQSGIINNPSRYPVIDMKSIQSLNEVGGDTNVATGYHTVEFLLWGQDLSPTSAGQRPYTDYVASPSNPHAARRAAYLKAATQLIIEQLEIVIKAWDPKGTANYSASFRSEPASAALTKVFKGMASLMVDEVAGERMYTAYKNQSQEDEQSCFSDTTSIDLIADVQSVLNIYYGNYAGVDGVGVDQLLQELAPAKAKVLKSQLAAADQAIRQLPTPFDSLIIAAEDSEPRKVFLETIFAIQDAGESLEAAAKGLGLDVKTGE